MDHGCLSFSISAPGKIILIGEHSVVYNKQGLASAIDKRTYLHFKEHRLAHDQITYNLLNKITEWDFRSVYNLITLDKPLAVGVKEFSIFTPELFRHDEFVDLIQEFVNQKVEEGTDAYKSLVGLFYIVLGMLWCTDVNMTPFDIEMMTDLTIGAGTGSSASFAACIAGAVYHYIRLKAFEKHGAGEFNISYEMFKPYKMTLSAHYCGFSEEDKEVINKWAYCVEKIMHGSPSGLDNTVCVYGNAVLINPLGRKEGESNLRPLSNFPTVRILLINSGIPRKTRDVVRKVADLKRSCPDAVGAVINAMGVVANEFIKNLMGIQDGAEPSPTQEEVFRQIETLIDLQQGLLNTIGVSHPRLEEICFITARRGLHSKLTGAGGGGYAFTLLPPDASEERVIQTTEDLRSAGFKVEDIVVNGEGIAIDFRKDVF
ncbi:mevalonate kinase [Nesidiocoris tenuis]|uniref:Mevalonate kinase n=1 Tax=Nesidiocoris tenuis TaxID=355587 RepID=A0ABN7AI94_9HEMI|nr:mevalonate kinase [Nesidiocoris tenuis]